MIYRRYTVFCRQISVDSRIQQGDSAFGPCLLLLHERLAGVPGLADLFASDVVAALELVEDERVELSRIDLAVFGQHGFIRDDIGDLPDDAVHRLGRYDLGKTAFHRDGELVDHRRVDVLRLRGRVARARELVGRVVT